MKDEIKQERMRAVRRFRAGEKPEAICTSLGRSRFWLYKWVIRYDENDDSWCENQSTQPFNAANRTPLEIEEIVKMVRLNLYNRDLFCGAQAILWELEDLGVEPLPSLRTINRILSRNGLTHRRTDKYKPKGTPYPKFPALFPTRPIRRTWLGRVISQGRFVSTGSMLSMWQQPAADCIHRHLKRLRISWTAFGPSGPGLAFLTIFRLTTSCPFSAVRHILAAWARSFASVCIMA